MINYQTVISELTKMDIANASLLDEATACAEAMFMIFNHHNGKRKKFFMSSNMFPQNIDVVKTKAEACGLELVIDKPENFDFNKAEEYCGVLLQNPDNLGNLESLEDFANKLHEKKCLLAIDCDLLSLAIAKPPGEMGADIAIGSA